MTMFKRISAVLFGGVLMFSMTSAANAVLLDFGNAVGSSPSFSEDGFTFTATAGNVEVGGIATPSTESEIKPNNLFSFAGLILTQDGGGAFDLNSFEIEIDFNNTSPLDFDFTIQGTKSDLSVVATTLSNLTAATSVAAQLGAFTDIIDATFTATNFFVVIDDINVTAANGNQDGGSGGNGTRVSEPGTLAILGIGLLGIAAIRRRRSN